MCDYDANIQYPPGTVWWNDAKTGMWVKLPNQSIVFSYYSFNDYKTVESQHDERKLTRMFDSSHSYCNNITPYVPPRAPAPVGTIWNTKDNGYPNRYYIMLPDGLFYNWGHNSLTKSNDDPHWIDKNRERINNNERV